MINLRTTLQWLTEHDPTPSPSAECWVLTDREVLPIIAIGREINIDEGYSTADVLVDTSPIWSQPPPTPLTYVALYDKLLETYSGGGKLGWRSHVTYTYRGSYVVNPDNAIFFLFLPSNVILRSTYQEELDRRKDQARQLTKEIEN
jgi:hypothetical protein